MHIRKPPVYFVLDENTAYRESIPFCINHTMPPGVIRTFCSPGEMFSQLQLKPLILISEYQFKANDPDGITIIQTIKEKSPSTSIIFITACHDIHSAVKALRNGAADYIPKSNTVFDTLIQKLLVLRRKMEFNQKSVQTIRWLSVVFIAVLSMCVLFTLLYNRW